MHPKQQSIGKDEAIKLADTNWWRYLSPHQIVKKQVYTAELIMPFDIFQEAVGAVIGYPVSTHQFASEAFINNVMEKVGEP